MSKYWTAARIRDYKRRKAISQSFIARAVQSFAEVAQHVDQEIEQARQELAKTAD